jgi:hypothetical protein
VGGTDLGSSGDVSGLCMRDADSVPLGTSLPHVLGTRRNCMVFRGRHICYYPFLGCTPPGCSLQAGRQSELPKGSVKLGSSQTGATVVGGCVGGWSCRRWLLTCTSLSLDALDIPQSGLHPCPIPCPAVDKVTAQNRHSEGLERAAVYHHVNGVLRPDLRSSMLLLPGCAHVCILLVKQFSTSR